MFNTCGRIGLLGVFHPLPNADATPIREPIAVELVEGLDELEGLLHHHDRRLALEVLLGGLVVDGDLAGAGREPDAGDGGLALARGVGASGARA